MAFMGNLARSGMFGVTGLAATSGKKKQELPPPRPTMISSGPIERSTSMIGSRRY